MARQSRYGLDIALPIRVHGFYEEQVYLKQLHRIGDQRPLNYKRIGSGKAPGSRDPVDIYALSRGPLRRKQHIYICIYGNLSSWRAPEGFYLDGEKPSKQEQDAAVEADRALCEKLDEAITAFRDQAGSSGTKGESHGSGKF